MQRFWILASALGILGAGCAGYNDGYDEEATYTESESRADRLSQASYVLNTWAGETAGQPIRFTQDLEVATASGGSCRVEAGSTYHPWAQLIRTRYKTQSLIVTYRARHDFEIQGTPVTKGQAVERLLQLQPGICRYRVYGEVVDTTCVDDKDLEKLRDQELSSRQSFLAQCADGSEAWVNVGPALFSQPGVEITEQSATGDVVEAAPLYVSQGWPGERPGPAVKVTADVSLLDGSCILKPGVYHPWATKTVSQYETVTAITTFAATEPGSIRVSGETRDFEVGLATGDTVEQLRLASEGWCFVRTSEAEGVARCFDGEDFLQRVESPELEKLFFSVDCDGGDPASIEVNAELFEIEGIERGTIVAVGEVEE